MLKFWACRIVPPFSANPISIFFIHSMRIGSFELANSVFVAPMAGVTDRPFRMLCKQLGAGYAVSEMVTSRPDLFKSLKTSRRLDHMGESGPIAVQIAGTDAPMMADAARYNIAHGAQIIDINIPFFRRFSNHNFHTCHHCTCGVGTMSGRWD